MRNWKSGRICNYLMKGLLLCALVVGGWFTAGIGAKAESLTHSVEFKSEESQIVQFKRADGLEQHIEVTNNTQRPMKVTFSHNVPIRNYHTELRIGGHEVASRMATAVKDANVLYLYPCQWVEKACEVKFTTSAPAYTDITISAEYIDQKIGFKEDEIGLTKDTAYEIPLSGHPYSLYEGLTGTGTGTDERWYKFNVADRAVIDPSFHLVNKERATYFGQNRTFIRVYDSNDNQIYSEASAKYYGKGAWEPGAKVLTRGTYYVCISTSNGAYYPAIFDFNLNGHDYISAEKIKCSHKEVKKSQLGNIKIVAETVPANSDDKIVEVYDHISGKSWKHNSNKVTHSEVPVYNIKAGRQSWLTFKTKNGKTYKTNLYVPAEKFKKPKVIAYHNYAKVTVGSAKMMGTNARIQIYKGGKWTTVKTVNYMYCPDAMKIKNLKPLTTYKFRTQAYANGTSIIQCILYEQIQVELNMNIWINPNINAITPYATATFVPWEMSYYNGKVTVTGYVVNNRIFKLKTYKVKVGVGVDNKIYASTTKTYKNVKDSTIKKVKFSFKSKKALDFVNNSPTWSVRTLKSVW